MHARDVERAPIAHPAIKRSVGSTGHDQAVRTILRLQRLAGNASVSTLLDDYAIVPDLVQRSRQPVGGRAVVDRAGQVAVQRRCSSGGCWCGEACSEEVSRRDVGGSVPVAGAPRVQRLTSDLQVKGKFEKAGSHPKQVFFDFDSAAIDGDERAKIDDFVRTSPAPTVLVAVSSEEGGEAVNRSRAQERGAAVAEVIGQRGPRPKVELALAAAADNPDYRFVRRVDLVPPTSSKDDECILDPDCDARMVTAIGLAQALAGIGQSAAANPHPPIRVALGDVFHASDDATAKAVAQGYGNVAKELGVLAAPDRHSCQTPCTTAVCGGGTRAFFDPKTQSLVGCPGLRDTDKSVVETILHEAVHGAPEIHGEDLGRLAEPLFPFLTTEAALRNPDSYVEFARIVTTGRRTQPRAPTGDFEASMSAEQRGAVGKAVAWAIRRLIEAHETSAFVYFALTAGHKDEGQAGRIDDVADERSLLKSERFGTTAPPAPPKARDQWIVEGVSNRLHKLLLAAGSKPSVAQGPQVTWSRTKNELRVNQSFFDLDVSQQARIIEFALIRSDPDIPGFRMNSYQRVVDQFGGLDISTTEGPP